MKTDIEFGAIDINTGEIQEGYIKNGGMKFKKEPFWKRLFRKKPKETKFIGVAERTYFSQYGENSYPVSVFKDFNPFTREIYSLYSIGKGEKIYYDISAYLGKGRFVDLLIVPL